MTGLDLITSAMRMIRMLAPGESPSAEEAQTGLTALNHLLDAWSAEDLSIFTTPPQTFALTQGKQFYTIGLPTSDFPSDRPARIEKAAIRITTVTPNLEFVLEMIDQDKWAALSIKQFSSTYPAYLWDNGNYPERTLALWPIPGAGLSLVLYNWQALSQFAELTEDHTFPPAYLRALRYNLAVELAAEFGASLTPEIAALAMQSKATMQILNCQSPVLTCDKGLTMGTRTHGVSRADFYGGTW